MYLELHNTLTFKRNVYNQNIYSVVCNFISSIMLSNWGPETYFKQTVPISQ
jgi:hypothetical protein